eukprot:NODE_1635_length_815_cov_253.938642_g1273_i0.p1 GENE.NODE_1635_length_815_cov_253.938642_g1273_i0~~NODE_1635_length_815_cov_253.938642_g1273_i0.p1  ORF type:complete len:246 (-),score=70.95 NODE_1635_length_815_cov_253.938642_g1273_i0:21-758(-)
MNTISCITNLAYYEQDSNYIVQHSLERVVPSIALLMLHDHPDIVHQSVQAFGNFSRSAEVRTWMIEKRIDEAIVLLMDHPDIGVVTAVCGVLMNFSADLDHRQLFHQFDALSKLYERLEEFTTAVTTANAMVCHTEIEVELIRRILKVLCNLSTGEEMFFDLAASSSSSPPSHLRSLLSSLAGAHEEVEVEAAVDKDEDEEVAAAAVPVDLQTLAARVLSNWQQQPQQPQQLTGGPQKKKKKVDA